jgi:hypothetical protein
MRGANDRARAQTGRRVTGQPVNTIVSSLPTRRALGDERGLQRSSGRETAPRQMRQPATAGEKRVVVTGFSHRVANRSPTRADTNAGLAAQMPEQTCLSPDPGSPIEPGRRRLRRSRRRYRAPRFRAKGSLVSETCGMLLRRHRDGAPPANPDDRSLGIAITRRLNVSPALPWHRDRSVR